MTGDDGIDREGSELHSTFSVFQNIVEARIITLYTMAIEYVFN